MPNIFEMGKDYIRTYNLGDILNKYMYTYIINHHGYVDYVMMMDTVIQGHLQNDIPIFGAVGTDGQIYYTSLTRLIQGNWDYMYILENPSIQPERELYLGVTQRNRYAEKQYVPVSNKYRELVYVAMDTLGVIADNKIDYSKFIELLFETYTQFSPEFDRITRSMRGGFSVRDLSW